jgi:hypothetical protein
MAMKKAPAKKTPISKGQAMKVVSFLKGQKGGQQAGPSNGPALPTPAANPVTTDDDDNDGE